MSMVPWLYATILRIGSLLSNLHHTTSVQRKTKASMAAAFPEMEQPDSSESRADRVACGDDEDESDLPTAVIVLGMAGSGKSSLMQVYFIFISMTFVRFVQPAH